VAVGVGVAVGAGVFDAVAPEVGLLFGLPEWVGLPLELADALSPSLATGVGEEASVAVVGASDTAGVFVSPAMTPEEAFPAAIAASAMPPPTISKTTAPANAARVAVRRDPPDFLGATEVTGRAAAARTGARRGAG
jgi:hypothetical protein